MGVTRRNTLIVAPRCHHRERERLRAYFSCLIHSTQSWRNADLHVSNLVRPFQQESILLTKATATKSFDVYLASRLIRLRMPEAES